MIPSIVTAKNTRNICLRILFFGFSFLLMPWLLPSVGGLAQTVDGFVTRIDSSKEFQIGTLHTVISGQTQCETQTLDFDIQLKEKTHAVH